MTVAPHIWFSFDTPWSGAFFTLDDPVKGVLDSATYTLSGDVPVDMGEYALSVSITRGRASEFDEFRPGVATVQLKNIGRALDPSYASGPFFGNITRGKRAQITSNGGRPRLTGIIDDWDFDYPLDGYPTATATIVDGLSTLAGINFNAWTGTASQTTGQRITSILDRPEVNYPASRNIGTGVATLTNDTIDDGTNVLGYIQLIADSDNGRAFDSSAGLLTFRDRHYVPLHLDAAVIAGAGGTSYAGISRREGKDTVRNYVKITLSSGAEEESFDEASIEANGPISLRLDGLPLETSSQGADLADFLAGAHSTPTTRFDQITFKMHKLSETVRDALEALDIGDPIAVTQTPEGIGDPVEQVGVIEGTKEEWPDATQYFLTLFLSRAEQTSLFILDDATYGVLDGPGLVAF